MANEIFIHFSDKTKTPITLSQSAKNEDLDITMRGLGSRGYSASLQQSFLSILENFASPTPPPRPIEGQLWYDKTRDQLNVYQINPTLDWYPVTNVYTDTVAPTGDLEGILWFDRTETQLKVFDGISYVSVADQYLHLSGGTVTGPVEVNGNLEVNQNTTVSNNVNVTASPLPNFITHDDIELSVDSTITRIGHPNEIILKTSTNELRLESVNNIIVSFDGEGLGGPKNRFGVFGENTSIKNSDAKILIGDNVEFRADVDMQGNQINDVITGSVSGALVPYSDYLQVQTLVDGLVDSTGDTMTGALSSEYGLFDGVGSYTTERSALQINNVNGIRLKNGQGDYFGIYKNINNSSLVFSHNGVSKLTTQLNNGNFDLHNNRLENVNTPTNEYDLANKQYADDTLNVNAIANQLENGNPRAWAAINMTIGVLEAGLNVASVTLNGDGAVHVNFVPGTFISDDYVPIVSSLTSPLDGQGMSNTDTERMMARYQTVQIISSTRILIRRVFIQNVIDENTGGLGASTVHYQHSYYRKIFDHSWLGNEDREPILCVTVFQNQ